VFPIYDLFTLASLNIWLT